MLSSIFGGLLGEWVLEREVAGVAAMKGIAMLTAIGPDVAEYQEEVSVHMADGQVLRGTQRYIYERTSEGLAVYFHPPLQGGRKLFHALQFVAGEDGELRAEGSHLCKDDLYRSTYVIYSRDTFTVEHEVRGPQKNYVLRTRYRRAKHLYTEGA